MKFITLNRAGDSLENPLIKGFSCRVRFHKHDSSVVITSAWITHGSSKSIDVTDMTSQVTEQDEVAFFDAIIGTEFKTATPAKLNVIHWTTSDNVHVKRGVYCAERPSVEILVNGYDAQNVLEPKIVPTLLPFGVGGT